VHPTNLHQLQDAILSISANISKEFWRRKGVKHRISMLFLIIL